MIVLILSLYQPFKHTFETEIESIFLFESVLRKQHFSLKQVSNSAHHISM